jgi:hypothetical protein
MAQHQISIESYVRENHGVINITKHVSAFREAPRTESKTEGSQVKLTETQKRALQSICSELGIGVSSFISQAIEHKLRTLPYESKLMKYEQAVVALLNSLP